MFNWICPQCGREVLASYSECPDCAKSAGQPQAQAPPQPVAAQPPAPAAAAPTAPPVQAAPAPIPVPQPAYTPPPRLYAPPPQRSGLPTWLMSILFAAGFVLLGWGVFWLINHNKGEAASPAASAESSAAPASANGAPAKVNPLQKFIEVTGVRLFQNNRKQVEAKFLIVNHSEAEMTDVGGTVELRGRTAKEGEEPVGTFQFKISSIGPNDAKEATAVVSTRLKVYELPDWQLTDARVHLSPP